MAENSEPFVPQWVSPPGDTIDDLLKEHGWTQAEFAARTGFTKKHVNELIKGKATISEDTALRLERVLGSTARFWLTREAQYREALARKKEEARLKADAEWLSELPIRDMVRFDWIPDTRTKTEKMIACLRFFGVASVEAWREKYEKRISVAAFRSSPKFEKKVGATAAWLRQGERCAAGIAAGRYTRTGFLSALRQLRSLTLEPDPDVFVPRLTEVCCQHGVAVVFLPAPKGCPASGATRWLSPDKAMLLLSLRHKTNDVLWFTFFHEVGHLVLHGKKLLFVDVEGMDGTDQEREREADRFARDTLIPRSHAHHLPTLGRSKTAVTSFARQIGIAPGIVVGRLQWEKLLLWSHLNDLKVRYRWADE